MSFTRFLQKFVQRGESFEENNRSRDGDSKIIKYEYYPDGTIRSVGCYTIHKNKEILHNDLSPCLFEFDNYGLLTFVKYYKFGVLYRTRLAEKIPHTRNVLKWYPNKVLELIN